MLRFESVVKRHRSIVLAEVDLEVVGGECVALLGANASGKTTLLRLAATLDRPSAGRVSVDGADTVRDGERARAALGLAGHLPGLWGELTVRENLEAVRRLRRADSAAVEVALARFGLEQVARTTARNLSRGYAQRTALARAALGDPPLLLLDEPAAALDADGRARLEALLDARRRERRATLVATHDPTRPWATRAVRLEGGRVRPAAPEGPSP